MKYIWPILLWVAIGLWSIWPTISRLGIPYFGWDGVLITALIGTPKVFDGGIFYPHPDTLFYSDLHRITALAFTPLLTFTHDIRLVYPWVLFTGQLLTGLVIYLWCWELSNRKWVAAVITSAVLISAIRIEYQVHLQMWSMQYWLLSVYLFWKYLSQNKNKLLLFSGLFLGLQWWESPLPVYFAILMLSAVCFGLRKIKPILIVLAISTVIGVPVIFKYWQIGHGFAYQRSVREAAHGGMSVNDMWEKYFSPGLIVMLIASIITPPSPSYFKRGSRGGVIGWLLIIVFVSFILALGPVLKWRGHTVKIHNWPIPLPYAPAYYLIPGMSAFRTPARWIWVTGFSVALLASIKLRNVSNSKLLILLGIILITGSRTTSNVIRLPNVADYPPVYKWLKTQPGQTLLELPVYLWSDTDGREEMRMIYRLDHAKTLANGFSGFTPPDYYEVYKNQNDWSKLPAVDYYVVHLDEGYRGKINGILLWHDEKTAVYSRN